MVGTCVELEPTWAPDSAAAGMLVWGALFGSMMRKPVSTASHGLISRSGESCSLSCHEPALPVEEGIHRFGMMPLPKNQTPNRIGNAPPAAYAVPLSLSTPTRRGTGTATLAPPASTPRRKILRGRTKRRDI